MYFKHVHGTIVSAKLRSYRSKHVERNEHMGDFIRSIF